MTGLLRVVSESACPNPPALHAAVAAFFANAAAETANISPSPAEPARLRGMHAATVGRFPAASADHAAS